MYSVSFCSTLFCILFYCILSAFFLFLCTSSLSRRSTFFDIWSGRMFMISYILFEKARCFDMIQVGILSLDWKRPLYSHRPVLFVFFSLDANSNSDCNHCMRDCFG